MAGIPWPRCGNENEMALMVNVTGGSECYEIKCGEAAIVAARCSIILMSRRGVENGKCSLHRVAATAHQSMAFEAQ
jgi:hypothetical protein